ncbi:PAS domain S-box protein, partial [candidate division KSB3 bacterium]|nr:PAS domain S-box protein [candidate division KSB3 bacterium]MBD3325158.1 PAS domain S-box protein [candidate division KSB3 bacterium]
ILAEELLINVTKFFRDPEAFEYLQEHVLPEIFTNRAADTPVRIWVIGCSTGEEAYSLAILFREYLESQSQEIEVKIFATDIDKPSLNKASAGLYPDTIAVDVPPQRLKKYFTHKGQTYQVSEQLRKMVIFADQNLLRDAPFNKIDLVTCRNLLIYLEPRAQKQALSYIHFALKPQGVLFLGKSETVGGMSHHFTAVSNTFKVYKKFGHRDLSVAERKDLFTLRKPANFPVAPSRASAQQPVDTRQRDPDTLYKILMEPYEPPAILINSQNEAEFFFGDVAQYVNIPRGKANFDILALLRNELSVPVSTALHQARTHQKEVAYREIPLKDGDTLLKKINLLVTPIFKEETTPDWLFIVFEELSQTPRIAQEADLYDPESHSNLRIKELETELQITKQNLQATVEELETSNEELQASNEELLASNEELQSTNEELQSVNEELTTVNAEYQQKLEELTAMTNDFDNLLQSTRVATLFLDTRLNIRKFTADLRALIHIVESDIGRSITHFSHAFNYDTFLADIQDVLRNERFQETEVQTHEGAWYLVRMFPYRGTDNVIEGVVVTFINITSRKETEQTLAESESRYRHLFHSVRDAICVYRITSAQTPGPFVEVNAVGCAMFGYTQEELSEMTFEDLLDPENAREVFPKKWSQLMADGETIFEIRLVVSDGTRIPVEIHANTFVLHQETLVLAMIRDISERSQAQ